MAALSSALTTKRVDPSHSFVKFAVAVILAFSISGSPATWLK